jgi:hypothetical protein
MSTRKTSGFNLLPTAALFGLGIGNLWGIAELFMRLGNPEWVLMFPICCLAVLIAFLCAVARIWLARGAVVPFLLIVVAAWIFSAPWAAANGKFTSHDWAVWFLVLMGCALVALLLAWLMERRSQKMVVTFRP